jgi:hypothetical protein
LDRLNLPAGILKELAKQRLKGISETMPGLNVNECLEYLSKPVLEYQRRSTKSFKKKSRAKINKLKTAIQAAK